MTPRCDVKTAVLEACRRLEGRSELTADALSRETGLSKLTCRRRRNELLAEGRIEKLWREPKADVLDACLRLRGRSELTPMVLSRETGFDAKTCRKYRNQLHEEGRIEKLWRERKGVKGVKRADGLGFTREERRIVRKRIAIVREAKARIGGSPLDRATLARLLPA